MREGCDVRLFELDRAIGFDLNKDTEDTLIPGVNQIYILSGYKTHFNANCKGTNSGPGSVRQHFNIKLLFICTFH